MELDLQQIVGIFSNFFGVQKEVALILVALTCSYAVLVVWAVVKLFIHINSGPRPSVPEVSAPRPDQDLHIDEEGAEKILTSPEQTDVPLEVVEVRPQPKLAPSEVPEKLSNRLSKTRSGFFDRIRSVFSSKPKLDPDMLEELEYLLVSSDLGIKTVSKLIEEVKSNLEKGVEVTEDLLIDQLKTKLNLILGKTESEILETVEPGRSTPLIVMMVGVNGVGKTTTCAKLAARLKERGLSVMLVAADTFRAAAVMQLSTWGERLGVPVVSGAENAKPQAVVFDAMEKAKEALYDVILIDTAGRLHTKTSLMQELEGVRNTVQRHFADGPQEVLLVVDGSTGQNALTQAKEFNEAVNLTGLIVTKLDGTPKGGIVVAIREALHTPVRYIGVGESHLDLRPFNTKDFVDALFDRVDQHDLNVTSAHAETRRRRRRGSEATAANE